MNPTIILGKHTHDISIKNLKCRIFVNLIANLSVCHGRVKCSHSASHYSPWRTFSYRRPLAKENGFHCSRPLFMNQGLSSLKDHAALHTAIS